jgi:hypothetical protein
MTIITVFLIVMVIALAVGNLLLHFTKPNGSFSVKKVDLPPVDQMLFESKLKATNELANMAHQRLTSVENFLKEAVLDKKTTAKTKKVKANPKTDASVRELEDKIHKLDNFRANTEVEMQAIKEIALAMKEQLKQTKNVKPPVKPSSPPKRKRKALKPMAA